MVISRALSGLALNHWPHARAQGFLRTVADAGDKTAITVTMLVYLLLAAAGLLLTDPIRGAAVLIVNALVFLWYRLMSMKQFGGVTGDLAGCFVTVAELGSVLALALLAGV
jgi:adenosylcobinamide-GDP ribazoletransferase